MTTTTATRTLQCMEIWGGNADVEERLAMPGVEAYVYARAQGGARHGGDVHYVSTCAHGLVARFAVADVAGHGESTAGLAGGLRRLMRRFMNELDQTEFLRQLNHAYFAQETLGRFATALLASFHRPTQHLVVCNAGHPRPLWYRSSVRAWQLVDFDQELPPSDALNLPIGVIDPTSYRQFAFPLSPGDVIVIYSDAYPETRVDGAVLGEHGLLDLVRRLDTRHPAHLGAALNAHIGELAGPLASDDQTLIVLRPTGEEPPPPGLGERLRVLGKMVGLVPV